MEKKNSWSILELYNHYTWTTTFLLPFVQLLFHGTNTIHLHCSTHRTTTATAIHPNSVDSFPHFDKQTPEMTTYQHHPNFQSSALQWPHISHLHENSLCYINDATHIIAVNWNDFFFRNTSSLALQNHPPYWAFHSKIPSP